MVYGRDPPSPIRYGMNKIVVVSVYHLLQDRDAMLDELKNHLTKIQQHIKINGDKHKRDLEFVVGQMEYLKLALYKQKSLAK